MTDGRRRPRHSSVPPPQKSTAKAIGRTPRMGRFLRVLIGITIAMHLPVAAGVGELASRLGWRTPWLVGLVYGVVGVLLFVSRARAGMPDRRRAPGVVRFVDIPYFIHWCACVFTIIPSVVETIVGPIVRLARGEPFALPTFAYLVTYALGLVVCGYGILVRRRWFVVKEIDVAIDGLDRAFDGFRIAHLSDLHIGMTTPRSWGERWTRAANAKSPDIAVVTGDMVTSGTDFHEDIADVVGTLRAKDGVFVSMGNHDYFGEGEPLISLIGQRGARVLRNAGVVLERDGKKLYLAAIDDTWTRRDDLPRALADRPDGAPTVLLAHDPDRFVAAAKENIELTLSGHTHAGQIGVPFLTRWWNLARLTHHFHAGMYTKGRSKLFVHAGLGTTGPPMRLGAAPEVVILTLRAA